MSKEIEKIARRAQSNVFKLLVFLKYLIYNDINQRKVFKDTKYIRLNFGEIGLKPYTRHVEYFHLKERKCVV